MARFEPKSLAHIHRNHWHKSNRNIQRYKNISEVIRAGLRLLEIEENKALALKNAIQEGIDSGIVYDFDPDTHLQELKAKKKSNG